MANSITPYRIKKLKKQMKPVKGDEYDHRNDVQQPLFQNKDYDKKVMVPVEPLQIHAVPQQITKQPADLKHSDHIIANSTQSATQLKAAVPTGTVSK